MRQFDDCNYRESRLSVPRQGGHLLDYFVWILASPLGGDEDCRIENDSHAC